jgi:hypothetical protein
MSLSSCGRSKKQRVVCVDLKGCLCILPLVVSGISRPSSRLELVSVIIGSRYRVHAVAGAGVRICCQSLMVSTVSPSDKGCEQLQVWTVVGLRERAMLDLARLCEGRADEARTVSRLPGSKALKPRKSAGSIPGRKWGYAVLLSL